MIKWGPDLDLETFVGTIIGEDEHSFYTISVRKKDIYVEGYNSKTFKQEFSEKIEIPEHEDRDQKYEGICFLDNNFILCTSVYDKKKNLFTSHSYVIDKKGKLDTNPKLLFSIPAESRKESGYVDFCLMMAREF